MKCFYHNDLDGQCAGAIVHKFYVLDRDYTKQVGEPCEFIMINYKDEFPFDKIAKGEEVIIVDFSLQKEGEFDRLLSITDRVIWIDHHKTAIEKHKHLEGNVRGIRQDGKAGCVLTWEWFYPNIKVPLVVDMLGAYDIWDFTKYGEKLNYLQCGIRMWEHNPENRNWTEWFRDYEDLKNELNAGYNICKYRDNTWASLIKSWSFWTEFEGHKAIACNAGSVSSQLFDSVKEDYDLMLPFVFDGKQWTVSIYTKKDIDCSEIAKKYGGGGHKKAAGFQCKELPFKKGE